MTFTQFQEQVKILNKDTRNLNNLFLQYISNSGTLAQILESMSVKFEDDKVPEELVVAFVGRLSVSLAHVVMMCSLINVDFDEVAKSVILSLMKEDKEEINKEEINKE